MDRLTTPSPAAPPPPGLSRRAFLGLGAGAVGALLAPSAGKAAPVRYMSRRGLLDAISAQLPLVQRRDWDHTTPALTRLRAASPYYRITVHHSGTNPFWQTSRYGVGRELKSILGAHRNRHYGDIAYHLIVDYSGRVWEGRSLIYEGAHTLSANEGNIGILMLGNFEKQAPSAPQLAAMNDLTAILRRTCTIRRSRLYGHRDLSPSVCPGRRLYPYVAGLRQLS